MHVPPLGKVLFLPRRARDRRLTLPILAPTVRSRSAIYPQVALKLPGFTVRDVAGDCLHPVHGRRGHDYLADLLIHWSKTSAAAATRAIQSDERPDSVASPNQPEAAATQESGKGSRAMPRWRGASHRLERYLTKAASVASYLPRSPSLDLPPPLGPTARHLATGAAACYGLGSLGSRGTSNGRSLLTIPWHTAACAAFPAAFPTADTSRDLSPTNTEDTAASNLGDPRSSGPATLIDLGMRDCSQRDERPSRAWLRESGCLGAIVRPGQRSLRLPAVVPSGWVHCTHALASSNKKSSGVVALRPGALLLLPLELSFVNKLATATKIQISMLYLTSYEVCSRYRYVCASLN